MAKEIIINRCNECPFYYSQIVFSSIPYNYFCIKKMECLSTEELTDDTPIPSDCPLPNKID